MIAIDFCSEEPHDVSIMAFPASENELQSSSFPKIYGEAFKRKHSDVVVEVFSKHPVLIAKMDDNPSRRNYEEAGAALYHKFTEGMERTLVIDIRHRDEDALHLLTGILLAGWRFDKYKTVFKPKERAGLDHIIVLCKEPKEKERKFARSRAIIEGIFYTRSLTSEPPNMLTPMAYAVALKDLQKFGVQITVLDENALHEAGMAGLLAVGKGSKNKPAAVIMEWNGSNSDEKPIAVVGKGICFDSGGLCLKQPKNQLDMKWDKAGAGVVAGLIKSLAIQQAAVHIIGVIGLAENMPDGSAMHPGDVIKTMSGQTVEIADTDAEGRLVLADCLWYAKEKFGPRAIVDLGTLCIETVASLGSQYGGLYTNYPALATELKTAGKICGEEVWELPMGDFFASQIKSTVADMKNVGIELCGENGAAAEFLRRFVGNVPWAHLDIAGVSWVQEDLPMTRKGVTGFGVQLLEQWIHSNLSKN